MKKIIILITVIVILAVGGYLLIKEKEGTDNGEPVNIIKDELSTYTNPGGDYSIKYYPQDWFLFNETDKIVIFTSEEILDKDKYQGTEGFALGPQFNIAVSQLTDIQGVTTQEEWFEANGMGEQAKKEGFLKERKIVNINELEMTRAVIEAAGAGGQVLIYVYFVGLNQVIVFNHYPYSPESDETKSFEEVVKSFNPVSRNTGEYKIFNNKEIGLSFSYPVSLGEVEFRVIRGETGQKFTAKFSNNENLLFGGITDDFSAGRSGIFTDTRGFLFEDGKYYFKFVSTKPTKNYEIEPIKIIAQNNETFLILDGNSFISARDCEGPCLSVGENYLGALINLKGDKFPGVAFWNTNTNKFSQEAFEELVKSIGVFD